jgi:hypothetical protein
MLKAQPHAHEEAGLVCVYIILLCYLPKLSLTIWHYCPVSIFLLGRAGKKITRREIMADKGIISEIFVDGVS